MTQQSQPHKHLPYFNVEDLEYSFGRATLNRARLVFEKSKVLSVKQVPSPRYSSSTVLSQFEASVLGSQGEHYDTRVTFIGEAGTQDFQIISSCDCPVGDQCKHAAAVCLYLLTLQHDEDDFTLTSPPSADAMRVVNFQFLLERIDRQLEAEHQDHDKHEQQWFSFHLFTDYESPHNLNGSAKGDVKIFRHHYTRQGRLAKPKVMRPYNYINQYDSSYTQEDAETARVLRAACNSEWTSDHIHLQGSAGYAALRLLIDQGRAYFKDQNTALSWNDEDVHLGFDYREHDKMHELKLALEAHQFLVATEPCVLIDLEAHSAQVARLPCKPSMLRLLLDLPPLSQSQLLSLMERLDTHQQVSGRKYKLEALPDMAVRKDHVVNETLQPVLVMLEPAPEPFFGVYFSYGEYMINVFTPGPVFRTQHKGRKVEIHRDIGAEEDAIDRIEAYLEPLSECDLDIEGSYVAILKNGEPMDDFTGMNDFLALQDALEDLTREGWLIKGFEEAWIDVVEPDDIRVDADAGHDWFDLSFSLQVRGQRLEMAPILQHLLQHYDSPDQLPEQLPFPLDEHEVVQLGKNEVAPLFETLLQLYQGDDFADGIRVRPFDAHLVAGLTDAQIQWMGAERLLALSQKLKNFTHIETIEAPQGLQATLRPYQAFGLSWLCFLHEHGFNGVLADDMGLGKTLQTLTWLLRLKQQGELNHPALLVMPTSLIGNWKSEAQRFAPDLSVLHLQGSDRMQRFEQIGQTDLVLTTYPLLPRDIEVFKNADFSVLILDEAQKIKNPRTKLYSALQQIRSQHRLCLTGTPVENHLGELWALFNFLMPGFLGNQKYFKHHYQKPIEVEKCPQAQQRLADKVAPFLLRRTKHQVVHELPDKTDIIKTVEFEPAQAKLYETIRVTMEKKVREVVAQKGLAKSQITLLDALLKLRQVCCDPRLVKIDAAKKVKQSAKLELLMDLLADLLEGEHRVIIFSQFTSMLALISDALENQGISYSKLTGQTKKREQEIDRFKQGETQVFLISLKAGGVGLNLTEADTVIHYDPWWNPAVENQATDRAYRIGQNKEVFVYKLVVANSIEEKILALQAHKKDLQDKLYQQEKTDEQGKMHLAADDLLNLLGAD